MNAALAIIGLGKDDLKKFLENIQFGRVVHGLVVCELDYNPFLKSIHSVRFLIILLSNHPGR